MKTKNDFLENHCSYPELAKKTLRAGGLSWEEIAEMGWDCYDASNGAAPGMIYYSDTVKFGKNNFALIFEALDRFEYDCGKLNKPCITKDGEENFYNWLAWFAWENTMSEVLNYLEID